MSKWIVRVNETIDYGYEVEATSEADAFDKFHRLDEDELEVALKWKESVGFEAPWTAEEQEEPALKEAK